MKILHINSSLRYRNSVSRDLTKFLIDQLSQKNKVTVDQLDLANNVPGHITQSFVNALHTPVTERTTQQMQELSESENLIQRLMASALLVIGIPMYNFAIPSHFKTFLDNIVVSGKTFVSDENGDRGLVTGKKAIVISTRGGLYNNRETAAMDFVEPYIRMIMNFVGITDTKFINVQPTLYYGPDAKAKAIGKAMDEILETVKNISTQNEVL